MKNVREVPSALQTGTVFSGELEYDKIHECYMATSYDAIMDWAEEKAKSKNVDTLIVSTNKGGSVSFKLETCEDGSIRFSQIY